MGAALWAFYTAFALSTVFESSVGSALKFHGIRGIASGICFPQFCAFLVGFTYCLR